MIKTYKKEEFKNSIKIGIPKCYINIIGYDTVYLVPMKKMYNYIKPDFNQVYKSDSKKTIAYIPLGNESYNSSIHIYKNGTFSQYRDGCFYEYVGKIAI